MNMFSKAAVFLSAVVLVLALTSVTGFLLQENGKLELEEGVAKDFFSFPGLVYDVLVSNEIRSIPPTFGVKHYFEPVNNLNRDIFGLNSYYIDSSGSWEVRLINFRDDSIVHTWKLAPSEFVKTDRLNANSEPRNSILLPNRHVIVDQDESTNLYRLDANSNVLWHNTDTRFHHGMNLGPDGNIWVCAAAPRAIQVPLQNGSVVFDDEFVTQVDAETGEVIFSKSVTEILLQNGYRGLVYGMVNKVENKLQDDPLHLNDIEPVLSDGPYWKKGDLLLSLRHRSLIILYRPSTGRIVRLIFGPFIRQHDVEILNDSTISIFNNEGTNIGVTVRSEDSSFGLPPADTLDRSSLMHYHFADSSFSYFLKDHFYSNSIFTNTQGFHQYLSDGMVYVEEYDDGIQYFMNEQEVVCKKQGINWIDDWVERPHWVRIYENIDF